MTSRVGVVLCGILIAVSGSAAWAEPATKPAPAAAPASGLDASRITASWKVDVQPILAKYCFKCHDGTRARNVNLARLSDEQLLLAGRPLWEKVAVKLRAGEMPPESALQPTPVERRKLLDWIGSWAGKTESAAQTDPGHVVPRRLNRDEYANTVRDLFELAPKRTWKYFVPPGQEFPKEGIEYRTRTYRLPWPLPPDEVDYGFDNIGEVLTLPPYLMEIYLEVAERAVDRAMTNRTAKQFFAVRPGPGKSDCEAARESLAVLAERAFRRPVKADEVERLVGLFDLAQKRGESFESAMAIPLRALLVSPHFLFRVERGVDRGDKQGVRPLGDYELASRLSYFLWSSMPDPELFRLARENKLSNPEVLEQQVRRMLRDPKAEALAENFALQWLRIKDVQTAMPDMDLFPEFYRRSIPWAMQTEALVFFDSIIVRDRSILELLDSDHTYVNDYLAEYYGLIKKAAKGPLGEGYAMWRRHALPDRRRGGVLTMAAVLTVTSNPTRTSPVKRGKWLLEAILGDPPPPPPPDVEELKEEGDGGLKRTFRQRLEKHRSNASCAACHQRMDPLGFALENFDAIGRWRDRDGTEPVDAKGTLKEGQTFCGPVELKALLLERKDDFVRCFARHLLTYALGRRLEDYDRNAIDQIVAAAKGKDYKFSALAVEIAKSYPFRYTRVHAKAPNPKETRP